MPFCTLCHHHLRGLLGLKWLLLVSLLIVQVVVGSGAVAASTEGASAASGTAGAGVTAATFEAAAADGLASEPPAVAQPLAVAQLLAETHPLTAQPSVTTSHLTALRDVSKFDTVGRVTPVTVTTRIRFNELAIEGPEQGVWMAGLSAEPGGLPSLLAVTFNVLPSGGFGSLWGLHLQSNRGLIPDTQSNEVANGFLAGSQAALLQLTSPQAGHEYETSLAYNPATGAASVVVVDVTAGTTLLSRNMQLNCYSGPMYPGAGVASVVPEGQPEEQSISIATVTNSDVADTYLPLALPWRILQRESSSKPFAAVTHLLRNRDTVLTIDLPWDSLPGQLSLQVELNGEVFLRVAPLDLHSPNRILITELPAGTYKWKLQYTAGNKVWNLDTQELVVGNLELVFDKLQTRRLADGSMEVSGSLRYTTDGPLGTVVLKGELLAHSPRSVQLTNAANDINLMTLDPSYPNHNSTPISFTTIVPLPTLASIEKPIWELRISPYQKDTQLSTQNTKAWLGVPFNQQAMGKFLLGETVKQTALAPGVDLYQLQGRLSAGPINAYLLVADLTNPRIQIDSLQAQTFYLPASARWPRSVVSRMVTDAGGLAGINSSLFEISSTMEPHGLAIHSGTPLKSGNPGWQSSVGFTADGAPYFGSWQWQGSIMQADGESYRALAGFNTPRIDVGQIGLFGWPWQRSPGYNSFTQASLPVTELVLTDLQENDTLNRGALPVGMPTNSRSITAKVSAIRQQQPGTTIEQGMMVVTGYGDAAQYLLGTYKQGDKVEIIYAITGETEWPGLADWRQLVAAVSGNEVLLRNGSYANTAVFRNSERNPRTAIATSWDQSTLYWLVVDGRSKQSVGMTYRELADFLINIGAFHALNLDGGGSTTLAVRDSQSQKAKVINTPSDGAERLVPDGLVILYAQE